jgi:ribonuclease-3
MTQALEALQQRIGYQFRDTALLQLALTHRSASKSHNERFEFLGDALLGFMVADALYHELPDASEGELTRTRAALVNKPALVRLAQHWQLGEALRLGTGERKSGGSKRESILADTVEAVVSAVYLDGGLAAFDTCLPDWLSVLRAQTDGDIIATKDAKTALQEWLQAGGHALPDYVVTEVSGPAHDQRFAVSCGLPQSVKPGLDSCPFQGEGVSKREAEQEAAAKALAALQSPAK